MDRQITTGRDSAEIMKDMLVTEGHCPASQVHTESKGGSTIEQAHNVAKMLAGTQVKIIKLVRIRCPNPNGVERTPASTVTVTAT